MASFYPEEEIAKSVEVLLHVIEDTPIGNRLREGLQDTPKRVMRMYEEVFGGYNQDPSEILNATFEEDGCETYRGMVIVKDIQFYSHCEHHMVPFYGVAHVGYIPNKKVVGLSKICRLVEMYAKRLQVQERLTDQIATALTENLNPMGVIVVIEAEHLCMAMRGVKKPGAKTLTSSITGEFNEPATRAEFLNLIGK